MKRFMKHHKWILSLLLVALIGVGATGAYLVASSGTVRNTFASGDVTTEIKEDLTAGKKVSVQNTGDLPVYVRARIVVGGADASKVQYVRENQLPTDLANSDGVYVVLSDSAKWQQNATGNNEWYYYTEFLPAGSTTDLLMTKVYIGGAAKVDESHFEVTITQEAVVASDTTLTTAAAIENAFAER